MATIDERVVSLKMNNKQFLSAIKESASSMDRLKESLKMQGAADGLSRIGEIAKNTTLGDLATKALDIGKNMSVMQGLAVTASVELVSRLLMLVEAWSRVSSEPLKTALMSMSSK